MTDWEGLTPPYATIVADPPWPYEGTGISAVNGGGFRKTGLPYSTLDVDAIADLSVDAIADVNAHLYLWTTNRYLWDARHIALAWGFTPAQVLVWCKPPGPYAPGGLFVNTAEFVVFASRSRSVERAGALIRSAREAAGMGRGELHKRTRGGKPTGIVYRWEADDCLPTERDWQRLVAVLPALREVERPTVEPPPPRGHDARVDSTWWQWPRGRHSEKPAAFLDIVEQVSPGPYVELFARAPRLGWDSWGKGYES